MGEVDLIQYLEEKGFNYDTEVPEELFVEYREDLEETSRTWVSRLEPDATTYRDSRKRKSVHLTDYRGVEREEKAEDLIVAHLEHFNPEHHPVLHALVDTPLWFYRNRIKEKNRL